MKKVFYSLVAALGMMLATSCGSDGMDNAILKAIPADAEFVAVGDAKTIIENAGCEILDGPKIKLSKELDDVVPGGIEDANDELKGCGIEVSTVAVFSQKLNNADHPIFVFNIDDKDAFIKWIKDKDYDEDGESDGITHYSKVLYEYDGNEIKAYVSIYKDFAYAMDAVGPWSDIKPKKLIEKAIEGAKEKSMASTDLGDNLCKGNAAAAAIKLPKEMRDELKRQGVPNDVVNMFKGYFCIYGNLGDDTAECTVALLDEEGKTMKLPESMTKYADVNAKVSDNALKYMSKDIQAIYAVALKDVKWDKYISMVENQLTSDERMALAAAEGYLKKIDGTVAIGAGWSGNLESFASLVGGKASALKDLVLTAVVETKSGSANNIINDMVQLIKKNGAPIKEESNGFALSAQGITIYGKAIDNKTIVLSTKPIKAYDDCPVVKNNDLTSSIMSIAISIPKSNKVLNDLGIEDYGISAAITAEPDNMELHATVKIDGKGNGVLARFINMCKDVYDNRPAIENKLQSVFNRYYGYDYGYDDYGYDDYGYNYNYNSYGCDSIKNAEPAYAYDYGYDYATQDAATEPDYGYDYDYVDEYEYSDW